MQHIAKESSTNLHYRYIHWRKKVISSNENDKFSFCMWERETMKMPLLQLGVNRSYQAQIKLEKST